MDVKIDVSGNVRFIDEVSVLGVATDDENYKKNVYLEPKVKRRITNYSGNVEKIHAILLFNLIKNELKNYNSIQICHDVAKNKLRNNLRKLFSQNSYWCKLESNRKIIIKAVGNAFVDRYVKDVRKGLERKDRKISLRRLKKDLRVFEKKNKGRHK